MLYNIKQGANYVLNLMKQHATRVVPSLLYIFFNVNCWSDPRVRWIINFFDTPMTDLVFRTIEPPTDINSMSSSHTNTSQLIWQLSQRRCLKGLHESAFLILCFVCFHDPFSTVLYTHTTSVLNVVFICVYILCHSVQRRVTASFC